MTPRNTVIIASVLCLAWSMSNAPAYGMQSDPVKVELEVVEPKESKPLRELAENFDAAAFIRSLDSLENREVPNMVDFIPRGVDAVREKTRKFRDPLLRRDRKRARRRARRGIRSHVTDIEVQLSFEGTTDEDNEVVTGFRLVPPDTEGDVGEEFYAQMNNIVFEIFDKETGGSVLGPLPNNIFWTGTGSFCEATNDGDPVVLFDHKAKRWLFSQFAVLEFIEGPPDIFVSHECFAISQTQDPTGAYFLYDFVYSVPVFGGIAALNDYPKIGVWPSGYFISVNEFEFFPGDTDFSFVGASAGVVDREAMLAGDPAGGGEVHPPPRGNQRDLL